MSSGRERPIELEARQPAGRPATAKQKRLGRVWAPGEQVGLELACQAEADDECASEVQMVDSIETLQAPTGRRWLPMDSPRARRGELGWS